MSTLPAQLVASQKASLDALLSFQNSAFASFEKLIDLNLRVTKATLEEVAQKAQEAMGVQDAQQALALASAAAQPSPEKTAAYGKHVYDILSGVQSDFVKLTEAQFAEVQKQAVETMDLMARNAPAGSENAVALTKSVLANATSAYDTLAKAAKQAAVVTESNLAAATSATLDAAQAARSGRAPNNG